MKTTPLLTLAVTVIAVMLLSSCSLISGRHYSLNLVKVQKNKLEKQKPKQVINDVSEQSTSASTESNFIPNLTFNEEKSGHESHHIKAVVKKYRFKILDIKKDCKKRLAKQKKSKMYPHDEAPKNPYAKIALITALVALALLILPNFIKGKKSIGNLLITGILLGYLSFITYIIGAIRSKKKSKNFGLILFGLILTTILVTFMFSFLIVGLVFTGLN
jgi:hypothetical protein